MKLYLETNYRRRSSCIICDYIKKMDKLLLTWQKKFNFIILISALPPEALHIIWNVKIFPKRKSSKEIYLTKLSIRHLPKDTMLKFN